ncbi:uncharacterized protein LOC122244359 isoform X2 [Penaeus japonicus]|uniref:uncharacterized protein LOC122244359 isoform X2 n=1 Tax=Penaeus japonicus TaxID=27405 RepID=UPI001C70EF45|nr:uncharacterized protein LOC122244359 isoform X2 [Penaeus japonicus]
MHAHTVFVALLALSATAHALPYALEDEDVMPPPYTEEELNEGEDIPTPLDDYNRYDDERDDHQLRMNYDDPPSFPAPVNRDPLADPAIESADEGNLNSARAMARLSIMERLLIALGPPFSEKLPKAPTNDTLATVPTPINITAEPCPYKYKRCSSQTFFPSCDIPRNTDPAVWPQRFNLFFNLSTDFDNKLDVINATLRLFKNSTVPFNSPQTLLIKVSAYTRSLTRRRAKTQLVADAQVSSDYIGWVSLSVDRMVRRWKKQRNNHGLLVTVTDPNQIPWDAPKLFVIMDCASGLVPLPFEVQTDEEGQRYPALNVRQGSLDDESPWPEEDGEAAAAAAVAVAAAAAEAGVSPVPSLLPEDVTFSMQSDDPRLYDEDDYADAALRQPTAPTHVQPHSEHAPEVAYSHGHSALAGPGLLTDREKPQEAGHAPRRLSSHGSERIPGRGASFGHSAGPSHSRSGSSNILGRHQGHALTQDFSHQATVGPFSPQEEAPGEASHRLHPTPATHEAHYRGGWGERSHSGERQEPTPATEEGRGHRQRGGSKERRQRKKQAHHHHRRTEERRAAV